MPQTEKKFRPHNDPFQLVIDILVDRQLFKVILERMYCYPCENTTGNPFV